MDFRRTQVAELAREPAERDTGAERIPIDATATVSEAAARLDGAASGAVFEVHDGEDVLGLVDEMELLRAALPVGVRRHILPVGQPLEFLCDTIDTEDESLREVYGRIQYGVTDGHTRLVLQIWREEYSSSHPPQWLGWRSEGLQDLGALPPIWPTRELAGLHAQLRARLEVHPIAGFMPSTARALEAARAYATPEQLARTAVRFVAPEGAARAFGHWLRQPGATRGDHGRRVRHLARVSLVLFLGLVEIVGFDPPAELYWALFEGVHPPDMPGEFGRSITEAERFERRWRRYLVDLMMITSTALSTADDVWQRTFADLAPDSEHGADLSALDDDLREGDLQRLTPGLLGAPLEALAPRLSALLCGELTDEDAPALDGPAAWVRGLLLVAASTVTEHRSGEAGGTS